MRIGTVTRTGLRVASTRAAEIDRDRTAAADGPGGVCAMQSATANGGFGACSCRRGECRATRRDVMMDGPLGAQAAAGAQPEAC